MTRLFSFLSSLVLAGALLFPGLARADDYQHGSAPRIIVQPPPDWCEGISVSVWAERQSVWEGDEVRLTVRTNRDAYIYVFSTDSRGVTRMLLPNCYEPNNFVRAHAAKRLPSGRYSLVASGPTGWDTIRVLAVSAWDGWRSPSCFNDYGNSSNPFPVFNGGYERARSELVSSITNHGGDHGDHRRQPRGERGIIVTPPQPPAAWGEAYTSIFVRSAPRCQYHDGCDGSCGYRPPPGCTCQGVCTGRCGYRPPYQPPCSCGPVCNGSCRPHYAANGHISISSWPGGASIFINGEYCGRTPVNRRLPVGYHEIRVSKPGYEDWCQTIKIERNCSERINVRLRRYSHRW